MPEPIQNSSVNYSPALKSAAVIGTVLAALCALGSVRGPNDMGGSVIMAFLALLVSLVGLIPSGLLIARGVNHALAFACFIISFGAMVFAGLNIAR